MKKLIKLFARFLKEQDGAAMTEYALLAFLIAVTCVGAVSFFGSEVLQLYKTSLAAIQNAIK